MTDESTEAKHIAETCEWLSELVKRRIRNGASDPDHLLVAIVRLFAEMALVSSVACRVDSRLDVVERRAHKILKRAFVIDQQDLSEFRLVLLESLAREAVKLSREEPDGRLH